MNKHLVLVGGGHAHMTTLVNLNQFTQNNIRATLISPSEHHYYSGMGPGMLGQAYTPGEIRFNIKKMAEKNGGTFLKDRVIGVDPDKQLVFTESGTKVNFDLLSFNAGSFVPSPLIEGSQDSIFTVKPIENLIAAQQQIIRLCAEQYIRVAVIGGGPAAIEVACNVGHLISKNSHQGYKINIITSGKILSKFPSKVRHLAVKSLLQRGITVAEHQKVRCINDGEISTEINRVYRADIIFLATGVRPPLFFKTSGLATGDSGGLLVNRYLQAQEHPNIFGGGDCIHFKDQPLEKVGVYAVRQNRILYHNLFSATQNRPLKPFIPGGNYLLIFNMGNGSGIFYKKRILFKGRLAFIIKDLIDRRFIRRFQLKK